MVCLPLSAFRSLCGTQRAYASTPERVAQNPTVRLGGDDM